MKPPTLIPKNIRASAPPTPALLAGTKIGTND